MGRLPEQTNSNLAMVSGDAAAARVGATSTRGEQDRLSMIERQIESMQQGADEAVAATRGTPAETAQSRVLALRRELADAQLTYTDKHPEDRAAEGRDRDRREGRRRRADAAGLRPDGDPQRRTRNTGSCSRTARRRRCASPSRSGSRRRITSADRQLPGPRRSGAAGRAADSCRCSASTDLERASYGDLTEKQQAALLERRAAAQAGRRAVRRARAGRPAVANRSSRSRCA